MKEDVLPYEHVVFVCTNARNEGERISCAGAGRCGQEILERMKKYVKTNRLEKTVRVAKSGCQEKCEVGPNAMVMPENLFFSGLNVDDADRLISRFLSPRAGA